jgi:CubicO group peptidase (beta-lactamase class C family)
LKDDAVVKLASATKLIASIALLQCIDKGLISLDEPLTKILPELENKEIIKADADGKLITETTSTPITARHLLSHTSGFTYPFLHPLIMKWKKTPEGLANAESPKIVEKFNNPLIFEPGHGWAYGLSLDWAGIVVKRLHNNQNFEDYCNENIWKRVGLSAPYPTFHISQHAEYKARLMGATVRTKEGGLKEFEMWQGNDPDGEEAGGHGLSATVQDITTILADLISDSPKLFSPATRNLMFQPQISPGSPGMTMLYRLRPAWETVAGPIADEGVNHGLGGFLTTESVPEIGQPAGVLCWGGASNVVWFASKEKGVAGMFATQIDPFGDAKTKELINAWKKDFWEGVGKGL